MSLVECKKKSPSLSFFELINFDLIEKIESKHHKKILLTLNIHQRVVLFIYFLSSCCNSK